MANNLNPTTFLSPKQDRKCETYWTLPQYSYSPTIRIGDNVYIGSYVNIGAIDCVKIEDGCVLSEYIYITDNLHGMHPDRGPIMEQPLESKGPVHIRCNCFLGFRVSVMPRVTLGEHCIVGANSVVTHSFPAYSMIVGSPAKLIKRSDLETRQWVSARE